MTGTGIGRQLDPSRRSIVVEDFERALRHKIVGQDPAVDAVVDIYQMFTAGLNPPYRPVGNLLFLGPTGTGKTHVVEILAEALFGDERALIKIDCAEFQHSHEISKLIGSPPGYLGHRETHPVLNQEAINQYHTANLRLTLLLFDEIEKASDALWQLLLGILDKGSLTLGDNRRVDLSCCVIVMTSNIGASEMSSLTDGAMGFNPPKPFGHVDEEFDKKIQRAAVDAAKRKFSPEFMNRIDKTVVFKTLRQGHLEQILELELEAVQQRILQATGSSQFIFGCSDNVKKHLLHEGTDPKYGARHLKRVIERSLVFPLSNLVATQQIHIGDFIRIDIDQNKEFIFTVESENSLIPVMLARFGNAGLKTAKDLPSPPPAAVAVEPSAAMKRARKKLKEAEEQLAEAKEKRRQFDDMLKNSDSEKEIPSA
jgi:ATP-dependent Clp protease ATP-binding subunit ClpA